MATRSASNSRYGASAEVRTSADAPPGTTRTVASAATGGIAVPLPSSKMTSGLEVVRGADGGRDGVEERRAREPCSGPSCSDGCDPGEHRVLVDVARGVLAASRKLDQLVDRGRLGVAGDDARLGRAAASHRHDHDAHPARGQRARRESGDRGLATAFAGTDDRDRRTRRETRPVRGIESEIGALIGNAVRRAPRSRAGSAIGHRPPDRRKDRGRPPARTKRSRARAPRVASPRR